MWAAYQGDAISVDILLRHSADPLLQDEKGMSALHWGVVKANKVCNKTADIGLNLTAGHSL
jgi:palmitoyltransferase